MVEHIAIGDRGITLTQLLKLVGWADSGGQAKAWIGEGLVRVNGEVELRKRRQLAVGDRVALEDGPTVVIDP
jgi:ribosome-associated protein